MSNRLRAQRRKPVSAPPAHDQGWVEAKALEVAPSPALAPILTHDFATIDVVSREQTASLAAPDVQRRTHLTIQPSEPRYERGAGLPVQRSGEDLGQRIRAAQGGGSRLPPSVQQRLERGLGADLSGVRVHTDHQADQLSRSVSATAFTTGSDIFFRHGAYNPSSSGGMRLLAHEATHTVQQARGPVEGRPGPGGVSISDPSDRFEREADQRAHRLQRTAEGGSSDTVPAVAEPEFSRREQNGDASPPSIQATRENLRSSSTLPVQRKFGLEIELEAAVSREKQYQQFYIAEQNPFKRASLHQQAWKTGAGWNSKTTDLYLDPQIIREPFPGLPYPTLADRGTFDIKLDHRSNLGASLQGKPDAITYEPPFEVVHIDENYINAGNDTQNPNGACVELVTKPMDEDISDTNLASRIGDMKVFADSINYGNGGRRQLNSLAPGADISFYVGMNYEASKQKKKGYVQATFGTKLRKIGPTLGDYAAPMKQTAPDKASVWENGARIGQEWFHTYAKPYLTGITSANRDELVGLMTLISIYLVSIVQFKSREKGIGKNWFAGIFYKSRLSDVVGALSDPSLPAWLQSNAGAIADQLMILTGARGKVIAVDPQNPTAHQITSEDWVVEVLQRTGDHVFEWFKNPYSGALGPEPVGVSGSQETGAIVEYRQVRELLAGNLGDARGLVAPDKWLDVAKAVRDMARLSNQ